MGYKSALRSINSSINKASREADRRERQQQREQERLLRKINKLDDRRESIRQSLLDLYAKGKISEEKFEKLQEREADITLPLLVFGKTAGASLAKRYLCGKIDHEEFLVIQEDIVPSDVVMEQQGIEQEIKNQSEALRLFQKSCSSTAGGSCQKCSRESSFFNKVKNYFGIELCRGCRSEYSSLMNFKDWKGEYFVVDSYTLDGSSNNEIAVQLRNEYL